MTPNERSACYNARRIIRAQDPVKFAKKHRFDQDDLTMRLVSVLPALLAAECVAKAEELAVKQLAVISPESPCL